MSKMSKTKTPDQRSKRFVFIPFCLICQAFQAQGIVKHGYSSVVGPIMEEIMKNDLNIIQMPCPESKLGGYSASLVREPKSINKYDTTEFRKVCQDCAIEVSEQIEAILGSGYQIVCILGIEQSPSCSVKLQYSNRGAYHRPGIFIEELQRILDEKGIEIPFLGINRRGMKITLKRIQELFSEIDQVSIKQKGLDNF